MTLRRITILLLLLPAIVWSTVMAADTHAGMDLTYHDGTTSRSLWLALDELALRDTKTSNSQFVYTSIAPQTAATGLKKAAERAGAPAFAVLYTDARSAGDPAARLVLERRFSLKLDDAAQLGPLLAKYGATLIEKVDYSPATYIIEAPPDAGLLAALELANSIAEDEPGIVFATPLMLRAPSLRLVPNDQLFTQQWHLRNTAQRAGLVAGMDANVVDAWDFVTGLGLNIGIIDTGVQVTHPDLAPNTRTDIDIDINGGDNDPSPASSAESHGTSVAGIAAARGLNSIGVVGAAFRSGIVGIRLEAANFDDAQEAQAFNHQATAPNHADRVHINNNSRGPTDNGRNLTTFGPLTKLAIENIIANGRGGLGTIIVWAGGNGRLNGDNVNYDGFASSRYTIAVGASGGNDLVSYYSEDGASLLINAPSSFQYVPTGGGSTQTVGTTTTNVTSYTGSFGGTSSASPLVAGIVALMLEANPNLGWRDVQNILINTAVRNVPEDAGWKMNGGGRYFHHSYGYGRVNARAATTQALFWQNLPPLETPLQGASTPNLPIPDNSTIGTSDTITLQAPPDFVVEHVEATVTIAHPSRGDLRIRLVSPHGMTSILATPRNDTSANYLSWMFTSAACWGEDPAGQWLLQVSDERNLNTGTLQIWDLRVHGHLRQTPTASGWQIR